MNQTCPGLTVAILLALATSPEAAPQRTVGSAPIGPAWQLERASLGNDAGHGVALSPDGKAIVLMGEPEPPGMYASLLLINLETGSKTLLRPSDSFLMPSRPGFSPDGRLVVFVVHGPTVSYPSDIYAATIDGGSLQRLTSPAPCTDKSAGQPEPNPRNRCTYYQRYYYTPRYSPDGSRILLFVDDEVVARELTAVIGPDGDNLEIVAEGRPCCWSADGKAIYYTHNGFLMRMDLETRQTQTVALPELQRRAPLGRMTGRDWLAFRLDNGRIGWYNVEGGKSVPELVGEWSVPGFKMAGTERLELKGFDWSNSNEVLLWYQGKETERFEVIRIFDPTSISR